MEPSYLQKLFILLDITSPRVVGIYLYLSIITRVFAITQQMIN